MFLDAFPVFFTGSPYRIFVTETYRPRLSPCPEFGVIGNDPVLPYWRKMPSNLCWQRELKGKNPTGKLKDFFPHGFFSLLTLLSDQVLAGFVFCWFWESLFLKKHREKFVLLNQPQNCQEEEAVALVQQWCSELRIFQKLFYFFERAIC